MTWLVVGMFAKETVNPTSGKTKTTATIVLLAMISKASRGLYSVLSIPNLVTLAGNTAHGPLTNCIGSKGLLGCIVCVFVKAVVLNSKSLIHWAGRVNRHNPQ